MAIFLVFATYALWSSMFTIGKATLQSASPLFITGSRMLIAGFILVTFLFFTQRAKLKLSLKQWFSVLFLGVFSIYLANILEFWGLQYLSAGKSCLIYSLTPFLSALFSYFQFKEKMTVVKAAGLLAGFLSFIPILMDRSSFNDLSKDLGFISWAELALMGAAASAAYGWILLKVLSSQEAISPLVSNGLSMLIGGSLALTQSYFTETWAPFPITNYTGYWQGIVLMILISNLICYNLYGWLLKKFSATFLSFAGLATPLFAATFGYLFLGEKVTYYFFAALIVIASALWIVYKEERRLGYITEK